MRLVDHHVHLFSPDAASWLTRALGKHIATFAADELVAALDRDAVEHAVVLSAGYLFGCPDGPSAPDRSAVQRENDWIAAQVARHRQRLTGFFSVNPLMASSGGEIDRCAGTGAFAGIKLHLTNSALDLRRRDHLASLEATFRRAADHDLGIVIHLRTRWMDYGAADVHRFIYACLENGPRVPVQIAHIGGWGGYDAATDGALGAFESWLATTRRPAPVLFDISAVGRPDSGRGAVDQSGWDPERRYERLAERLLGIGLERVLFGTDWPDWEPRAYAEDFWDLLSGDLRGRVPFGGKAPWIPSGCGGTAASSGDD